MKKIFLIIALSILSTVTAISQTNKIYSLATDFANEGYIYLQGQQIDKVTEYVVNLKLLKDKTYMLYLEGHNSTIYIGTDKIVGEIQEMEITPQKDMWLEIRVYGNKNMKKKDREFVYMLTYKNE